MYCLSECECDASSLFSCAGASMKSKPSKEKAARESEEEESENVVINIKSTLGKYEQGEGHFGYAVDYDPSTCAGMLLIGED